MMKKDRLLNLLIKSIPFSQPLNISRMKTYKDYKRVSSQPLYRNPSHNIFVHPSLYNLVNNEILTGLSIEQNSFWKSLETILYEFAPTNRRLLEKRDELQSKIDTYHKTNKPLDPLHYKLFLQEIGYLLPQATDVSVKTTNVDVEIASLPGPQLVVPVDNARYALNAANSRWGSLLDALYGTDAIPLSINKIGSKGETYNPVRGDAVFAFVYKFLDDTFPLSSSSHAEVTSYFLQETKTETSVTKSLAAKLKNESTVTLTSPTSFTGYKCSSTSTLTNFLLKNNGLHVEIVIDSHSAIGKTNAAGIKDIVIESAVTAICDLEDSVAAVDADDKCKVYSNWCGLMKGDLFTSLEKGGKTIKRTLNKDKDGYLSPDGYTFSLHGRALLLVRNVGIHMYTDAVLLSDGSFAPEGIVDAMITSLSALHDLKKSGSGEVRNSRCGSVYIVKPKMHGPEEVAFTVRLFERVEQLLGMNKLTLKVGVMDEERRTTVNLGACIKEAKDRLVFINTGFLDRTGDEIHTSMEAGIMVPKTKIKSATWRGAYENWNVDHGLQANLHGKGQIGKGMWAIPDNMSDMLKSKGEHPRSAANTAWVPSPTAATLHALHYHQVDVLKLQKDLVAGGKRGVPSMKSLMDILTPPIATSPLTKEEISHELRESAQAILGYVVRWIEQGVGCSKVPDLMDVGLMEDRATLRISSQLLANWLHHKVISESELIDTFKEMAKFVDGQNADDKKYRPMSADFDNSISFQASIELCTQGTKVPNGYTEPILTDARRGEKEMLNAIAHQSKSKL